MNDKNIDSHIFRLCVEEARKCIIGKDDFSLEARSLLAHLIYDNKTLSGINLAKLNWESMLRNYSDWVDYYNVSEMRFNNIKEFLVKKNCTEKVN